MFSESSKKRPSSEEQGEFLQPLKRRHQSVDMPVSPDFLVLSNLDTLNNILSNLSLYDAVKCRRVSLFWKKTIDSQIIEEAVINFCHFFAPEKQSYSEKLTFFLGYLARIHDHNLRSLCWCIATINKERMHGRLTEDALQNIVIKCSGQSELPKPNNSMINFNILHYAAICGNEKTIKMLCAIYYKDKPEDIPEMRWVGVADYQMIELVMMSGKINDNDLLRTLLSSVMPLFDGYCDDYTVFITHLMGRSVVKPILKSTLLLAKLIELIYSKPQDNSAIGFVISNMDDWPKRLNDYAYISLLDWAIVANCQKSLQILLKSGYYHDSGLIDNIVNNAEEGATEETFKNIILFFYFCPYFYENIYDGRVMVFPDNVFAVITNEMLGGAYDAREAIENKLWDAFGLLRAANLAIHLGNLEALGSILDCYRQRASEKPDEYPNFEKILVTANHFVAEFKKNPARPILLKEALDKLGMESLGLSVVLKDSAMISDSVINSGYCPGLHH